MKKGNSVTAIFSLLRAGLWEKDVRLSQFEGIAFNEVYRLAEEQSVIGLIAAGLEHVVDVKVPQIEFLTFIGRSVQLEQQNSAMNDFIGILINRMRKAEIYALLVKGQGIAQCYERPLWRSCGDVDLFLDNGNYDKAKALLTQLATSVGKEYVRERHLGMTIDSWTVELHGSLYSGLSSNIEKELDNVYQDTFYRGNVRIWENGKVPVFLLSPENDAFYVFTHFLQHFYKGGVGLRQIMDYYFVLRKAHEVGLVAQGSIDAVTQFGMERFAQGLMWVMKEVFAMPEEWMLWNFDEKEGRFILKQVMGGGNFGHYGEKRNRLKGSLKYVESLTRHSLHLLRRYPSEAFWTPVWIVWHKCWKMYMKRLLA